MNILKTAFIKWQELEDIEKTAYSNVLVYGGIIFVALQVPFLLLKSLPGYAIDSNVAKILILSFGTSLFLSITLGNYMGKYYDLKKNNEVRYNE